jgi:hypothetical protein
MTPNKLGLSKTCNHECSRHGHWWLCRLQMGMFCGAQGQSLRTLPTHPYCRGPIWPCTLDIISSQIVSRKKESGYRLAIILLNIRPLEAWSRVKIPFEFNDTHRFCYCDQIYSAHALVSSSSVYCYVPSGTFSTGTPRHCLPTFAIEDILQYLWLRLVSRQMYYTCACNSKHTEPFYTAIDSTLSNGSLWI